MVEFSILPRSWTISDMKMRNYRYNSFSRVKSSSLETSSHWQQKWRMPPKKRWVAEL